MGENNIRRDERYNGNVTEQKRIRRTAGESGDRGSTRPASAGRTGRAGRTAATGKHGETFAEISSVEIPEETNKADATDFPIATKEAPKEASKPKPKQGKPKQVRKKKKNNAEQLSGVIQSATMLIASRPGKEHWQFSKEESDKIAEPLANILENSEAFEKIAEHSDALALCFAVTMAVVPRAFVEIELSKAKPKKQKNKREVQKNVELRSGNAEQLKRADENRAGPGDHRTDNTELAAVRSSDAYGMDALIPAII